MKLTSRRHLSNSKKKTTSKLFTAPQLVSKFPREIRIYNRNNKKTRFRSRNALIPSSSLPNPGHDLFPTFQQIWSRAGDNLTTTKSKLAQGDTWCWHAKKKSKLTKWSLLEAAPLLPLCLKTMVITNQKDNTEKKVVRENYPSSKKEAKQETA